jgi:hypothetical protein
MGCTASVAAVSPSLGDLPFAASPDSVHFPWVSVRSTRKRSSPAGCSSSDEFHSEDSCSVLIMKSSNTRRSKIHKEPLNDPYKSHSKQNLSKVFAAAQVRPLNIPRESSQVPMFQVASPTFIDTPTASDFDEESPPHAALSQHFYESDPIKLKLDLTSDEEYESRQSSLAASACSSTNESPVKTLNDSPLLRALNSSSRSITPLSLNPSPHRTSSCARTKQRSKHLPFSQEFEFVSIEEENSKFQPENPPEILYSPGGIQIKTEFALSSQDLKAQHDTRQEIAKADRTAADILIGQLRQLRIKPQVLLEGSFAAWNAEPCPMAGKYTRKINK